MTLKVGIIGLGVGEAHIAGYESSPECKVVSLCDIDTAKIRLAKKKYPALNVTKNAKDILRDPQIQVVSIASYDNFHYEQIVEAIKHNKHIFVEKPLCLYEKEARHIRQLLRAKPHLKMSCNYILRKVPRFNALKTMIQKNQLGKLYYAEGDYNYGRLNKITHGWRGKIPFYSVVYGGGVHMIDLVMCLSNDPIVEVTAIGNRLMTQQTRFKYNDCVASSLRFKSVMIGKMTANFGCVFPHFHLLSLYGKKATFINDVQAGRLFTTAEEMSFTPISEVYPGVKKGDLIYPFVDSIIKGTKAFVGTDDVFKAMSVCFAIEKASATKKTVKVQYI